MFIGSVTRQQRDVFSFRQQKGGLKDPGVSMLIKMSYFPKEKIYDLAIYVAISYAMSEKCIFTVLHKSYSHSVVYTPKHIHIISIAWAPWTESEVLRSPCAFYILTSVHQLLICVYTRVIRSNPCTFSYYLANHQTLSVRPTVSP